MDNRINEIRKEIRALRFCMLVAEATMREQIAQDEDCAEMAREMLTMRAVMGRLANERQRLGDHEPIVVVQFFMPRRAPAHRPVAVRTVKRHLVPPAARCG
jgi:hypothetical protein